MYILPTLGIIAIIILPVFIVDFHARGVFIATAYPRKYGHGKTWKKARKHYKSNWSFFERMLWLVVFKEYYDTKYRMLAYFAYAHFLSAIITVCCFLISINFFPDSKIWIYIFAANGILWMARVVYDDAVGRKKI